MQSTAASDTVATLVIKLKCACRFLLASMEGGRGWILNMAQGFFGSDSLKTHIPRRVLRQGKTIECLKKMVLHNNLN